MSESETLGDDEKRRRYPRDHFTWKDHWTKDTSTRYYESMPEKVYWPIAKSILLLFFGYGVMMCEVSLTYTIAACLFMVWLYPHIVALLFGKIYMGAMDRCTFNSSKVSIVNFMSVTGWDGEAFDDP